MASSMAPALSLLLFKPLDKSPIITPFSPSSNSLQINFDSPRLLLRFNHSTLTTISCAAPASNSSLALTAPSLHETNGQNHWIVVVKAPPLGSRPDVIDYYVQILTRVLGSEKDAQCCIYNASCDTQYGFCCDLDEEASQELARNLFPFPT
ncbi:putative peptidase S8 propeptide/proteinase inhibitor I9 superfamily [Helianthus annuus]|nr:putative peptidase S8 propeptide/proteinase inhibitor I9 superfamily [Helianthus annuus]